MVLLKFELRLWHRASSSQLCEQSIWHNRCVAHADPSKWGCGIPHHHDSMMHGMSWFSGLLHLHAKIGLWHFRSQPGALQTSVKPDQGDTLLQCRATTKKNSCATQHGT